MHLFVKPLGNNSFILFNMFDTFWNIKGYPGQLQISLSFSLMCLGTDNQVLVWLKISILTVTEYVEKYEKIEWILLFLALGFKNVDYMLGKSNTNNTSELKEIILLQNWPKVEKKNIGWKLLDGLFL